MPFSGDGAPRRYSGRCRKLVERARHVIAERRPVAEAAPAIQGQRRLECRAAAGFQAQPLQAFGARDRDQMFEQGRGRTLAQERRMRAHRLQFATAIVQRPQGADRGQRLVAPHAPHPHVGAPQTGNIQRIHAFRRRLRLHLLQVVLQQPTHRRIVQLPRPNHKRSHRHRSAPPLRIPAFHSRTAGHPHSPIPAVKTTRPPPAAPTAPTGARWPASTPAGSPQCRRGAAGCPRAGSPAPWC